ncbi:hypothetical protein VTO73DRAFT_953 [Trametes versicolor]
MPRQGLFRKPHVPASSEGPMRLGRSQTNVVLSLCTRLSAIPARLEGPHTSHPAAMWWWHGDALAAMSGH